MIDLDATHDAVVADEVAAFGWAPPGVRILNLTPHDITVYPSSYPDVVPPEAMPDGVIDRATGHESARISMVVEGPGPVLVVPDGGVRGPMHVRTRRLATAGTDIKLPDEEPDVWLIVSLPVALSAWVGERDDLWVIDREVRNPAGTVVGCRGLAKVLYR